MTLRKIIEELEARRNYLRSKKDSLIAIEMPVSKRLEREKEYKDEIELINIMLHNYYKNK